MSGAARRRPGSGAGDEPVEHERQPARRRADDQPDERRDLEPADGRERRERVARVRLVDGEATRDGVDLAAPAGVVDAGPAAGHLARLAAGQRRDEGAGRGRVADPHLADAEELDPVRDRPVDRVEPNPDRGRGRLRSSPGRS
jgi:hypothetical protein